LIALVSAFYAIRTFVAINKMRAQFKQLLARDSDMTYSLYFRLMALAGTEIIFTISITTAYIALNSTTLDPWISWEDTHYDFDRVDQYPGILWRQETRVAQQLELTRWLYIVCAVLFFSFFGFAEEVRKFYGPPFQYVFKRFGICRPRSQGITFQRSTFSNSNASTRNEKWSPYKSDITFRDIHTIDHSDSIHLSPCPSLRSSTPYPVPEVDV
jgi:pheromone a factor receptor